MITNNNYIMVRKKVEQDDTSILQKTNASC